MRTDVHFHFADFFPDRTLKPYIYLLSKRLAEGHICIPLDSEDETPFGTCDAAQLSRVSPALLGNPDHLNAPFILDGDHIYIQRYYKYEHSIFSRVSERLNLSAEIKKSFRDSLLSVKSVIQREFTLSASDDGAEPDWQFVAVMRCLMEQFGIITGGPGTGKTTTLAKLLLILYSMQPEARVALAAPTGKASMRMVESLRMRSEKFPEEIRTKIQALKPHTLHMLLGYRRNSVYFRHDRSNLLPYDCVVVDEASMIDVPMFSKLMDACAPETRLILLGDKDQLASVEAGTLLGDLCLSANKLNHLSEDDHRFINDQIVGYKHYIPDLYKTDKDTSLSRVITELKFTHRFGKDSDIGKLSRAVIGGDAEETKRLLSSEAEKNISIADPTDDKSFTDFVCQYGEMLKAASPAEALTHLNQIRVLVTVRQGPYGLYGINERIEKILRARFPGLINPQPGFYHNQPIIITQNNYDTGLYNGDVGIIRKEAGSERYKAWFEASQSSTEPRSFNPALLSSFETAFAMTIHKSQGSEFLDVMVVLPEKADNPLLTRELLYTGITRARRSVLLVGTEAGLVAGLEKKVQRFSGLKGRFSVL